MRQHRGQASGRGAINNNFAGVPSAGAGPEATATSGWVQRCGPSDGDLREEAGSPRRSPEREASNGNRAPFPAPGVDTPTTGGPKGGGGVAMDMSTHDCNV